MLLAQGWHIPCPWLSIIFLCGHWDSFVVSCKEAVMGLWEVTGGLSAVRWLCFHHPVPVSGSGPNSSLHQAWVRGYSVWMSRR